MKIRNLTGAAALTLAVAALPAVASDRSRDFNDLFTRFDANRDGVISRAEWPGDLTTFDRLDLNRDGVITQSEARSGVNDPRNRDEGFRRLDRNGDGVVSRGEWPGNATSFDRLDRNRDGVLTRDEMMRGDRDDDFDDDRDEGKSDKQMRFRGMDRNGARHHHARRVAWQRPFVRASRPRPRRTPLRP